MSFGFSVSDFVSLARMTVRVYNEFREAPKICDGFRTELLILHSLLTRTTELTRESSAQLSAGDKMALTEWSLRCKKFIYGQIYGGVGVGDDYIFTDVEAFKDADFRTAKDCRLFRGWRQRWGEKSLAAKIPRLQRSAHYHVLTLTAINSNIVR